MIVLNIFLNHIHSFENQDSGNPESKMQKSKSLSKAVKVATGNGFQIYLTIRNYGNYNSWLLTEE